MSRGARVAIVVGSMAITLVLGFPYSCSIPECLPEADYCGESSMNLIGMEFRGCWPLPVTLASIAVGLAAGLLIVMAVDRIRRSTS